MLYFLFLRAQGSGLGKVGHNCRVSKLRGGSMQRAYSHDGSISNVPLTICGSHSIVQQTIVIEHSCI